MTEPAKDSLGTADILKIMQFLPHRYPFLLIDRVVEIDRDESAIGIKNVTVNEPQFQGHFPQSPVMPGVLIIEAMAQTAGAIAIRHSQKKYTTVYFLTIDKAKFRHPVTPGDQLELHVRKLKQRRDIWKYSGVAMVDGVKVAEAELSAMMAGEPDL